MLVRVTDMAHTLFGDAKLTLSDPTGRITATVHRDALAAEPLLTKGAVLLLQKVTLHPHLHPHPHPHPQSLSRDHCRLDTGNGRTEAAGWLASHQHGVCTTWPSQVVVLMCGKSRYLTITLPMIVQVVYRPRPFATALHQCVVLPPPTLTRKRVPKRHATARSHQSLQYLSAAL
jgi:hypothetical protein